MRLKQVFGLASERVSAREFSNESVALEDVLYALDVARQAPSGANRQPWRFLIVTDGASKERIREHCEAVEREFHEEVPDWMKSWFAEKGISPRKRFLTQAPVLLLVFGREAEPYWTESVWLAIGYVLLALQERGLASLTYTPSKVEWVEEFLKVPQEYVLNAIIPIGRPEPSGVRDRQRLGLEQIVFFETWGQCRYT